MTSQPGRQIKTIVGANIRAAREAKGLTQSELASRLPGKVESPGISRWERGLILPGLTYLVALAHVLDRSVDWFYVAEHSDDPDPIAA